MGTILPMLNVKTFEKPRNTKIELRVLQESAPLGTATIKCFKSKVLRRDVSIHELIAHDKNPVQAVAFYNNK